MKRPRLALTALACLLLTGCEMVLLTAAVGATTMAFVNGEGRKTYPFPYTKVEPIVVDAAAQLALRDYKIDRGSSKTVITGTNVDDEDVRIKVISRSGGKNAEVRVLVSYVGDFVNTTIVFDYLNEKLGLPPEPHSNVPGRD